MSKTTALGIAVLFSGVLLAVPPAPAGQAGSTPADPWYSRTTRAQFQPVPVTDVTYRLEWPKKDWMLLPSGGSLLVGVVPKKGDAVVLLERMSLQQALDPADITDLFAQIETDAIKERHPTASDFQSRILENGALRLVAVQFSRPGVLGSEKVRQYSIPVGRQLYRLTCASRAASFAAYEPLFAHMAATFSAQ